MWVHIHSRADRLWTVGHYAPDGQWHPESDHESEDEAARRVHYLNGGQDAEELERLIERKIGEAINNHISAYHASEC